jgi:hypothetical protein
VKQKLQPGHLGDNAPAPLAGCGTSPDTGPNPGSTPRRQSVRPVSRRLTGRPAQYAEDPDIHPLSARQGWQVTAVDLSAAFCRSSAPRPPPAGPASTSPTPTLPARPGQTFDTIVERHLLRTLPDPGKALAARRAPAPGARLALIEGSSGCTGRPLSPRISVKQPGEPHAAVTDAQNMQSCVTGPKANLLSTCGA